MLRVLAPTDQQCLATNDRQKVLQEVVLFAQNKCITKSI